MDFSLTSELGVFLTTNFRGGKKNLEKSLKSIMKKMGFVDEFEVLISSFRKENPLGPSAYNHFE